MAPKHEDEEFSIDNAYGLTPEQQNELRQLTVTSDGPGTILKDVQIVIDWVGTEGIETRGKYGLFPIKHIADLNERLSNSLNLNLKRPQQKSFPHINGLYLLLRTVGLLYLTQKKNKQYLILDEKVLASWHSLNPTEQYFTLLEAWFIRGNVETIGERASRFSHPFSIYNGHVHRFPLEGDSARDGQSQSNLIEATRIDFFHLSLALFEMFGFLSIKTNPAQNRRWDIQSIHRSAFGDALLLFLDRLRVSKGFMWEYDFDITVSYGEWQPALQNFFTEWQNNIITVQPEFQDGVYVYKVTLGEVWRRIAFPAKLTLEDLSDGILDVFDFDNDHLYQFRYRTRYGFITEVNSPDMDEGPFTTDVVLGEMGLEIGTDFIYLFDFGDNWEFEVTLERVDPQGPPVDKPLFLEGFGEPPEQYPSYEPEGEME